MIVFNITTKVEKAIETQWLEWVKNFFSEDLNRLFNLKEYKLFLLIIEDDAPTYVLQLYFKNDEDYENYMNEYADVFHAQQQSLFGTRCIGFETLMQQLFINLQ